MSGIKVHVPQRIHCCHYLLLRGQIGPELNPCGFFGECQESMGDGQRGAASSDTRKDNAIQAGIRVLVVDPETSAYATSFPK
jgi:hypothetical protein